MTDGVIRLRSFLAPLAVSVAAIAMATGEARAGRIFPSPLHRLEATPTAVAAGDLDDDGLTDIVVGLASGALRIYRGNGDLTTAPGGTVPIAGSRAIAFADLDRDGTEDLVVAAERLCVAFGRTAGSPAPPVCYGAGLERNSLVLGDFNQDKKVDAATANGATGEISVFLGSGNGAFATEARYPAGGEPFDLRTADVNLDGHPDLVVARRLWTTVTMLPGSVNGRFGPAMVSELPGEIQSFSLGDLDRDGRPDVVYVCEGSVNVAFGQGDGTFRDGPWTPVNYPRGRLADIADHTGDGHPDVVLVAEDVSDAYDEVLFLKGIGDGTLARRGGFRVGHSEAPVLSAVADLDRDGLQDLVVANQTVGYVATVAGLGRGEFGPQRRSNSLIGTPRRRFVTADFDSDAVLDLAFVQAGRVTIAFGTGDGRVRLVSACALGPVENESLDIAGGDFNRDGRADVAVLAGTRGVSLLHGRGDASFDPEVRLASDQVFSAVVVDDFNDDRIPDLALSDPIGNAVIALIGTGAGAFEPAVPSPVGWEPEDLVAGDFNGDGRRDLITANSGSGDLSLLAGLGDGRFAPEARFGAPSSAISLATGDLNHDGSADVAGADGGLKIFQGRGDGSFLPPEVVDLGWPGAVVDTVVIGDVNGDQVDDVIASIPYALAVLPGNATGPPGPAQLFLGTDSNADLAVGDFNSDGRDDILTRNEESGDHHAVWVQLNQSGTDADLDGIADGVDTCTDTDADGWGDPGRLLNICPLDNCAGEWNPDQADFDGDSEGDACDLDDGVIRMVMPHQTKVAWQAEWDAGGFDLYRGDLEALRATGVYTQDPSVSPSALRLCGQIATVILDVETPLPGGTFFYLVAPRGGSLGQDSAGVERPNSAPCL